jgi:hypothetical protein
MIKMLFRREPGCRILVVTPGEWKRGADVPLTGSHAGNKTASVDLFKEELGPERIAALKSRVGPKLDDCADAYWMCKYGLRNYDKLMERAQSGRTHSFQMRGGVIRNPLPGDHLEGDHLDLHGHSCAGGLTFQQRNELQVSYRAQRAAAKAQGTSIRKRNNAAARAETKRLKTEAQAKRKKTTESEKEKK